MGKYKKRAMRIWGNVRKVSKESMGKYTKRKQGEYGEI